MDKQVLSMPNWDWPPAAHSGPEGLESSPQSWLDIRKTCQRHQKLLEIFAEGHASTQSATHLTLMEQVPYRLHCHQPFNFPYSAQMQNSIVPVCRNVHVLSIMFLWKFSDNKDARTECVKKCVKTVSEPCSGSVVVHFYQNKRDSTENYLTNLHF